MSHSNPVESRLTIPMQLTIVESNFVRHFDGFKPTTVGVKNQQSVCFTNTNRVAYQPCQAQSSNDRK